MVFQSGLSGLIRACAAVELDWERLGGSVETIAIGTSTDGCFAQICGAHLLYDLRVHSEQVFTGVSLLDSAAEPQTLLRSPDSEQGWELTFRFISSLELYKVQSLERPIQVGDPVVHLPETCWIIS